MDDHKDSTDDGDTPSPHSGHEKYDEPTEGHDPSGDDQEEPRVEQSLLADQATDTEEADKRMRHEMAHGGGHGHGDHGGGGNGHDDHGGIHAGHEQMFRRRFFVSTLLSIPVLLYSETLQERLGVVDEEYVSVESRQGRIVVRANVEETSGPDVLFIPMQFVHGAVNTLTREEFDPQAKIPEYKVTNVRVEPLGMDPVMEPSSPEELADSDSASLAGDD